MPATLQGGQYVVIENVELLENTVLKLHLWTLQSAYGAKMYKWDRMNVYELATL